MPETYTPGQTSGKPGMKKNTKTWLLIGALGAGGLVIWYVVKNRSSANSATTTGASALADQGIDPNTGIPYAEEYGGSSGAYGTTPSLAGYIDPTTGAYITGGGSVNTGQILAPSTNASWAQQVESYLENLGYDPTTVAAAIGKYLTGQGLTSDQAGIVAAAQGFFGNPPQGAPAPVTVPPTGQNGGGGGPSPKTKAPGGKRLFQIAEQYGLTVADLFKLNPGLRKYEGKPIPKGTTITL